MISSSIPITTAYTNIVMAIYSAAEFVTGLHSHELTDYAAARVGLGTDAGFADILVAVLSSH